MTTDKKLIDVSLRLNWEPQTENGGFFIALWNGYYEDEGLRVSLDLPDPTASVALQISNGTNEFGLAEPVNVVLARAKGLPVVAISQIQHDAYLRYIAKKSSGIQKLEDIKGKKVSLFLGGGEYEFLAMINSVGLSPSDLDISQQSLDSMDPFFKDQIQVASVTLFNELQQVFEAGYKKEDLLIFSGKEYNVGLVAKGIITSEKMIREKPEIVQGFLNASIRGLQYAYNNPETTSRMFVEHYSNLNYEKMLQMMVGFNGLNTSGRVKEAGLGYLDGEYFDTAKRVMKVCQELASEVISSDCYNESFWENVPLPYKFIE